MKVLIIASSDIVGGAHRAAYRLHLSLLSQDIDSQMLVQNKISGDYTVTGPTSNFRKFVLNPLRPAMDHIIMKSKKVSTLFSSSYLPFSEIVKQINKINPDIVHLHWITGGMIRIEDVAQIKPPVIWSLHDMWAFTGGCHYDKNCGAYKNSCGACPVLGSTKNNDLSRKVSNRKQKTFNKKKNMTVVGLSYWLNDCSKNSTLLKNKNHINLPNPIDTRLFKPFGKNKARELWRLPKEKKLILFGAVGAISDPRKGFKELSEALHKLQDKDIELVVFGSSEPKKTQDFGFKTHYLGHLHDDISLITLYSAVDVMVVPSLQENLSNAIMESLSCSTPVVGFNIGGNGDMIEHKKTGYLAKPFDANDLKDGIEWVVNNENYDELCDNARDKVVREFDSKVVAKKYIELYKEVLDES